MSPQSKPRHGGRVDDNQAAHVTALQQASGFVVEVLSNAGNGLPDLLVWDGIEFFLVETKDGKKPPSKRRLTKPQEKFHKKFKQAAKCGRLIVSIDAETIVKTIEDCED